MLPASEIPSVAAAANPPLALAQAQLCPSHEVAGSLPSNPEHSYNPQASLLPESFDLPEESVTLGGVARQHTKHIADGGDSALPGRHSKDGRLAPPSETNATGWTHGVALSLRHGPETGSYTLRKVIAQGGHGEIWQAVQLALGRVVAIKRLREDSYLKHDVSAQRYMENLFRREALVTGCLDHPNICPVYDLGMDGAGRPFLSMKLVEGEEWTTQLWHDREAGLATFFQKHVRILISVARAVAFAHDRGVLHRDLKPGQVMLGRLGEALLMDWGLAVVMEERQAQLETRVPSGLNRQEAPNPAGTVVYMAPEQTERTARRLGTWTDVYLLGGMLYFMLCGSAPHAVGDSAACYEHAQRGDIEHPEERLPYSPLGMPPALVELALDCLQPAIGARPPSAEAVIERLEAYLSGASSRERALFLLNRAETALRAQPTDYTTWIQAESDVEQAAGLWPGAERVRQTRIDVGLGYLELALERGDLQLAGSLARRLPPECAPRSQQALAEIARQQQRQRQARRQLRQLRQACLALLIGAAAVSTAVAWHRSLAAAKRDALAGKQMEAAAAEKLRMQQADDRARDAALNEELSRLRLEERTLAERLRQTFAEDWPVPPSLAFSDWQRQQLAAYDKPGGGLAAWASQLESAEALRTHLQASGIPLEPPVPDLHHGAALAYNYAAWAPDADAGERARRLQSARQHWEALLTDRARRFRARVGVAAVAWQQGERQLALQVLDVNVGRMAAAAEDRTDYLRLVSLHSATEQAMLPPVQIGADSLVVQSRLSRRRGDGLYRESGPGWIDSNAPAEFAQSRYSVAAAGAQIGSRKVVYADLLTTQVLDSSSPLPAPHAKFGTGGQVRGLRQVYMCTSLGARCPSALVAVHHAAGNTTLPLVQDGARGLGTSAGERWVRLGQFEFSGRPAEGVELGLLPMPQECELVQHRGLVADAVLFTKERLPSNTVEAAAMQQTGDVFSNMPGGRTEEMAVQLSRRFRRKLWLSALTPEEQTSCSAELSQRPDVAAALREEWVAGCFYQGAELAAFRRSGMKGSGILLLDEQSNIFRRFSSDQLRGRFEAVASALLQLRSVSQVPAAAAPGTLARPEPANDF